MRRSTLVLALSAALLGSAMAFGQAAPPSAAMGAMTADPLPPGPDHDLTVRVCSGCHSPQVAAKQRLDAAGWHEIVQQMGERGADASDAELARITAYLARSFPAK